MHCHLDIISPFYGPIEYFALPVYKKPNMYLYHSNNDWYNYYKFQLISKGIS